MKTYEIADAENRMSVGTLLYYEKADRCVIELVDGLDEWTAPLLFTGLVKKNVSTVPYEYSYLWVQERVIPYDRQNIQSILKRHRLPQYDEMTLLELSEGRCSQDSLYIKKIDTLPDYVRKRAEKNVEECVALENNILMCIFADGTIKKVDISSLVEINDIKKIVSKQVFQTAKVGAGGYAVVFNESLEISARTLYDKGETISLSRDELMLFVNRNLVDTSQTCEMLGCTRQNLSYLIGEKYILPIKENAKGNLYLRGEICRSDLAK